MYKKQTVTDVGDMFLTVVIVFMWQLYAYAFLKHFRINYSCARFLYSMRSGNVALR